MSLLSLIALVVLAGFVGHIAGKKPESLDIVWQQTIKWLIVLSSFLWLGGGVSGAIGVFLVYQGVFVVFRNRAEGRDIWFIDEETWLGEQVKKYLGIGGSRTLFFIEFIVAILLLL